MEIGFVGLGKMGMNMVKRLQKDKHRVVVYDRMTDIVLEIGSATVLKVKRSEDKFLSMKFCV
jgi:6-phosphogluconate dehydrogenase (decarboxylating)